MTNRIQEAKEAWPFLEVWADYGLPPEPEKQANCFHPLRDEQKSASFSVFWSEDHQDHIGYDHSTGESFDAIALFAALEGVSNKEAVPRFIEKALGIGSIAHNRPARRIPNTSNHRAGGDTEAKKADRLDSFKSIGLGKVTDTRKVCEIRGIPSAGVSLAFTRGNLRFGRVGGFDCWIATDQSGLAAAARRMDGKPFPAYKGLGERKSHSLKGSLKCWPMGIKPVLRCGKRRETITRIEFCEGEPDLIAAHQLIIDEGREWETIAVGILGRGGKGSGIHPDALQYFKGKEIRFHYHDDKDGGGKEMMKRYADQLYQAGITDRLSFEAYPEGDLNDRISATHNHNIAA